MMLYNILGLGGYRYENEKFLRFFPRIYRPIVWGIIAGALHSHQKRWESIRKEMQRTDGRDTEIAQKIPDCRNMTIHWKALE
jgi:hypothetical protein